MADQIESLVPYNGVRRAPKPDPFESLQALLGPKPPHTPSSDPSVVLNLLRNSQADEEAHNLTTEKSLQGSGTPFATGSNAQDLASLLGDIKDDPTTGTKAQSEADANGQAMQDARLQGFGSPQEASVAAQRAATFKEEVPILTEQMKGEQQRLTNQDSFDTIQGLQSRNSGGQGQGSVDTSPYTSPNIGVPSKSPSILDFFTGKSSKGDGTVPYNDADSQAQAFTERQKARVMATPFTPLLQAESYGNLEQMVGMFPGVRGFGYLLPLLKDHQANFGLETPADSYARAKNIYQMLGQTDQEMGDPSVNVKIDAQGRPTMVQPPQTVAKARLALADTQLKMRQFLQEMEKQYPGIGGTGTAQPPVSPNAGGPSGPQPQASGPAIGTRKTFPNGRVGIWDGKGYQAQ